MFDVFTAIAEPRRRQILEVLREGECSVSSIADRIDASQPVVSKHLRLLRDSGMVRVEPRGQQRLYRIEPGPLAELDVWIAPYRQFWVARFDALEQHLAGPAPSPPGAAPDRSHPSEDHQ